MSSCASNESKAPAWYIGKPLYEVYLRALSQEGTINALTGRLDDYKAMGVETLWLMPIHPVGKLGRKGSAGSPYAVADYFEISPEYGTKEDFRHLIEEAHERKMRIMMDMVINHSANDHHLMKDHPDWWMHDSTGAFTREVPDWSDVTDWNHDNDETRQHLTDALLYWVQEFDVDGYRCDVAGMVPDEFWLSAIQELKSAKPSLFMLAEWGDPQILGEGLFDAAYDWELFHRMKAHQRGLVGLDSLWKVIDRTNKSLPAGKQMMRFIENHDEHRSAEDFGWPGVQPYAALTFSLPGVPLLYVGQEIGETHRPILFEPEPIDWSTPVPGVKEFYTELLKLRNGNPALLYGTARRVPVDAPETLVFVRDSKQQSVLVAINFSEEPQTVQLPAADASMAWVELTRNDETIADGEFSLQPGQYRIFGIDR